MKKEKIRYYTIAVFYIPFCTIHGASENGINNQSNEQTNLTSFQERLRNAYQLDLKLQEKENAQDLYEKKAIADLKISEEMEALELRKKYSTEKTRQWERANAIKQKATEEQLECYKKDLKLERENHASLQELELKKKKELHDKEMKIKQASWEQEFLAKQRVSAEKLNYRRKAAQQKLLEEEKELEEYQKQVKIQLQKEKERKDKELLERYKKEYENEIEKIENDPIYTLIDSKPPKYVAIPQTNDRYVKRGVVIKKRIMEQNDTIKKLTISLSAIGASIGILYGKLKKNKKIQAPK